MDRGVLRRLIPTFRLIISVAFAAPFLSSAQAETADSEAFVAAFGRKKHAHPYANMITLWDDDRTSNGVYYDWGLAGARGASFTVIRLPSNTLCDLRAAVREIRRQRDVVSLHKLTIHRLVDWNPAPVVTAHLPDDTDY